MPETATYRMISDHAVDRTNKAFGATKGDLTFWTSDGGNLAQYGNWTETTRGTSSSRRSIAAANGLHPVANPVTHHEQQHVALFVHGYNNTWSFEATRYQAIGDQLFTANRNDPDDMGICVWFDWPSKGTALGYYPDRDDAGTVSLGPDRHPRRDVRLAAGEAGRCRRPRQTIRATPNWRAGGARSRPRSSPTAWAPSTQSKETPLTSMATAKGTPSPQVFENRNSITAIAAGLAPDLGPIPEPSIRGIGKAKRLLLAPGPPRLFRLHHHAST